MDLMPDRRVKIDLVLPGLAYAQTCRSNQGPWTLDSPRAPFAQSEQPDLLTGGQDASDPANS
jgi:hypothetical protein